MVVYHVNWLLSRDLCKGKGRAKSAEEWFCISVLCRNSKDAIACAEYYFDKVFPYRSKFDLDDGVLTLKRGVIDSRGFTCHYLMTDCLREPIDLIDIKSNSFRLHKLFK